MSCGPCVTSSRTPMWSAQPTRRNAFPLAVVTLALSPGGQSHGRVDSHQCFGSRGNAYILTRPPNITLWARRISHHLSGSQMVKYGVVNVTMEVLRVRFSLCVWCVRVECVKMVARGLGVPARSGSGSRTTTLSSGQQLQVQEAADDAAGQSQSRSALS
jgi:hypothetical protein